ncbi:hypothetical protein DW355_17275 [Hylemonella gracilis]|uniref:Preprotein translocase subunit YajC n=1 Tax=Hylemonella gracilis TaxID=80880 RepID=A0A4P6ULY6_9BURK|nr:PP0621 family protein [Hylemonella gracilis]QBK06232.1 hypothetical protein DW355_17275 [Hylemonella gracilis]
MKFLLFLLVMLLAVWLWRSGRTAEPPARRPAGPTRPTPRKTVPQDMVRCAHCGLHLPLSEAVVSTGAHYCSTEHRRLAEPGTY